LEKKVNKMTELMTERYLLMQSGTVLSEFVNREEAVQFAKLMGLWHPENAYEVVSDDE